MKPATALFGWFGTAETLDLITTLVALTYIDGAVEGNTHLASAMAQHGVDAFILIKAVYVGGAYIVFRKVNGLEHDGLRAASYLVFVIAAAFSTGIVLNNLAVMAWLTIV